MDKQELIYRGVLVVCGTALFICYSITGQNGLLTGAAGTLIGLGVDLWNARKKTTA